MSMNASVHTNAKGNITIQLKGGLDYENSGNFQKEFETLFDEHPTSIITLDLYFLDFVGSSGIGSFVEVLDNISKSKKRLQLSNVKPEFLKVFKLYNFAGLQDIIIDLNENISDETGQAA